MKPLLAALALTASLTGCATRWVVDSDVRTFSEISAVPAGATYRFERLPSQQYDEASRDRGAPITAPGATAAAGTGRAGGDRRRTTPGIRGK